MARQTTVRIFTPKSSGSGVIVQKQGDIYTILTSWHVIAFSNEYQIMTPDGHIYQPSAPRRRLGNTDMGVLQFRSHQTIAVASLSQVSPTVGETVWSVGFPVYRDRTLTTTFEEGVKTLKITQGVVSLLLPKSMPEGYNLGYTNDVEIGMSGGPIFNCHREIVGINGRSKERDADFGVYTFEDGSEPSPALLARMVKSSWGIPIGKYLQFASSQLGKL
ncbi:MAG: S1 family peptidase [Microcoleaceae cyanobacterium]